VSKTVVFFLSDLQSGGTEWFALRLARGLAKHGHRPVFLLAQKSGELLSLVEHEFEIVPLSGHGYSLWRLVKLLPAIIHYIKKTHPDVIISGLPLLNAQAGLAVWLARVPLKLILVEHMRLRSPKGECVVKDALRLLFVRMTHCLSQYIVCVSRTVVQDLSPWVRSKNCMPAIIHNPVIPDDLETLQSQPAQHPWLLNKTGPVIVAIGRLLAVKDYPTLIRAFAQVKEKKPDARMIIFGEGVERFKLEFLIAKLGLGACVSLAGVTTNVFCNLKNADLFVLSSSREAFGNVIVEALAVGTKVVCTDCGGPREILEDGKYGCLVPIGNPSLLAQGMLATLETAFDKELLQQRGLSFSTEKATKAYLQIIEAEA